MKIHYIKENKEDDIFFWNWLAQSNPHFTPKDFKKACQKVGIQEDPKKFYNKVFETQAEIYVLKKEFEKKYKKEFLDQNIDISESFEFIKKTISNLIETTAFKNFQRKIEIFHHSKIDHSINFFIVFDQSLQKPIHGMAHNNQNSKLFNTIKFLIKDNTVISKHRLPIEKIFLHELTHIYQYPNHNFLKRKITELCKKNNIDNELKIYKDINEVITTSVSHPNIGYIHELFYEKDSTKIYAGEKWKKEILCDKPKANYSLGHKWTWLAFRIIPLTKNYLDNEKPMDEEYIQKVFDLYYENRSFFLPEENTNKKS